MFLPPFDGTVVKGDREQLSATDVPSLFALGEDRRRSLHQHDKIILAIEKFITGLNCLCALRLVAFDQIECYPREINDTLNGTRC